MEYPAHRHYGHLDLSEPIPEIEPRVDPERVRVIERLWGVWKIELAVLLTLLASFMFIRIDIWLRLGLMLSVMFLFLIPMLRGGTRAVLKRHKLDPWGLPLGLQLRYQGAMLTMMFAAQSVAIFDHSLANAAGTLGLYAGIMGGMGFVAACRFRHPGQISCEDCGYPLVGLKLPCPCPECGHMLLDLSFTTDRPRLRDNRLLYGGAAVAVVGLGLFIAQFAAPNLFYAPMPRPALLHLAATDRDAFEQIDMTKLTSEDEKTLVDAMVRRGMIEDYRSSRAQKQWLAQQILAGNLSQAQLDRLYAKLSEIQINAPARARVGEPVGLRLSAEYAPTPSIQTEPVFYFRGFAIGNQPPRGGSPAPRFRLYITDDEYSGEPDAPG